MEKQLLFTETIKGESRTYFVDMKEARNGKPYLSISETFKVKDKDEFDRNRIFVFEGDFEAFASTIAKAMEAYAKLEPAAA